MAWKRSNWASSTRRRSNGIRDGAGAPAVRRSRWNTTNSVRSQARRVTPAARPRRPSERQAEATLASPERDPDMLTTA